MPPLDPNEISLYRESDKIPPEYWEELNRCPPEEVCRRALVTHDPETGYALPFLNDRLLCRPATRHLQWEKAPERSPGFQEALVSLIYLLRAREIPLSGIKVNEKELNGGALFFRGPHALSKEPLEKKFARNPRGFLEAGLTLGGIATKQGDGAFELRVLPRIPLEYIFYAEDDEFPAQLIITFDRTIDRHLPLDVIWALVNLTTQSILKAGAIGA
jgi:Domain of unknown function (DUF3786)